jgi:hypothetical protein
VNCLIFRWDWISGHSGEGEVLLLIDRTALEKGQNVLPFRF